MIRTIAPTAQKNHKMEIMTMLFRPSFVNINTSRCSVLRFQIPSAC